MMKQIYQIKVHDSSESHVSISEVENCVDPDWLNCSKHDRSELSMVGDNYIYLNLLKI